VSAASDALARNARLLRAGRDRSGFPPFVPEFMKIIWWET
jgi:hypothetical protein